MNKDQNGRSEDRAYRVVYLVLGYIRNTLTPEEHKELDEWVNADDKNMQMFEELTDEKDLEKNLAWMDRLSGHQPFQEMYASGKFRLNDKKKNQSIAFTIAASLLAIAIIYKLYTHTRKTPADDINLAQQEEVYPGGNRATLTLPGGRVIDLATMDRDTIEAQARASKSADDQLVYDSVSGLSPVTHRLSTPVGGRFGVRLADGTLVWLNSSSSLTYPSAFLEVKRRVILTGEAYFEVASNAKRPFEVMLTDSTVVTVTGTRFNVTSYEGDPGSKITLLEGSVKVRAGQSEANLEPGMQASVTTEGLKVDRNADIEEATGWKSGLFVFRDASLESIMRDVERWYGVRVAWEAYIKQQFNATIKRDEPLSKLLKLLELNGYVHFKLKNNTVYVLP